MAELLLRVLFLLFCNFIVFVCEGVCMGDKPSFLFNIVGLCENQQKNQASNSLLVFAQ